MFFLDPGLDLFFDWSPIAILALTLAIATALPSKPLPSEEESHEL